MEMKMDDEGIMSYLVV